MLGLCSLQLLLNKCHGARNLVCRKRYHKPLVAIGTFNHDLCTPLKKVLHVAPQCPKSAWLPLEHEAYSFDALSRKLCFIGIRY